jgi:hypothetical protein
MTDELRWSEAGDPATQAEQLLVRAGQDLAMPSGEKQAIWNQLLAALPPTVALPAQAKIATVSASGSLLALKVVKVLCVLAAVSGLAVGGYHWLKKPRSSTAADATAAVVNVTVAPAPIASIAEVQPTLQPEATNAASAVAQVAPPSRASQLREESVAVMAARQALHSNDPAKALHLLEQAQQRFKRGALTEEREALAIEALAKSGQSTRAAARAKAFLSSYPRSPHVADVRRFVAE